MFLPLGSVLTGLSAANWMDIGCALVACASILQGGRRGLSTELPLGVGWVCGILAAWYAFTPARTFFHGLAFMQDQPEMILFCCLITSGFLAWGVSVLVSCGLRLLATQTEKTAADHLLGGLAGAIRAVLLVLVVTAILLVQSPWKTGREVFCHQSRTGQVFTPWATRLLDTLAKLRPEINIHRRTDDPGDINAADPNPPR